MDPVRDVLRAVRLTIGSGRRELQRPHIDTTMKVDGTLYRSPLPSLFEEQLERYTKAPFVVALASGTAALHLALVTAGVRLGDEVLCPSLTFAATANAIVHAGAIPHLIDVNQSTFGIHPFKLSQYLLSPQFSRGNYTTGLINKNSGRRVTAIVAVHLLGIPCEIEAIKTISDRFGLILIEDAAEALGSHIATGAHCGTIGKAGVLSFNANKIVTTSGGGALMTSDQDLERKVKHLSTQARVEHPFHWIHDAVGWNYRMPSICAGLGIPQLERLGQTLEAKARLAYRYGYNFADIQSAVPVGSMGNNWINACLLDPRCMDKRDAVIQALISDGFEARALFMPMHMLDPFKHCPRQDSLESSEDLWRRTICLPSTP